MDRDRDEHGYPRPHGEPSRQVLNERWPLRDAKGERHARAVRDQPNPIPVRARVVWETSGDEWLDGMAQRWTRQAVFVALDVERLQPIGVWLRPTDVRRR